MNALRIEEKWKAALVINPGGPCGKDFSLQGLNVHADPVYFVIIIIKYLFHLFSSFVVA